MKQTCDESPLTMPSHPSALHAHRHSGHIHGEVGRHVAEDRQ